MIFNVEKFYRYGLFFLSLFHHFVYAKNCKTYHSFFPCLFQQETRYKML